MINKVGEIQIDNVKFEIHPLCMIFPWLDQETMKILKEDMKKYGQRDTIKQHEGQILDGKNRLRALKDLELKPRIEVLPEDTNPVAYVRAVGLCRRDLKTTKRVQIAKLLDTYEQEQLSREEKEKIEQWKKDPKKREIIRKQEQERIAIAARTTVKVVAEIDDIEEKAKKDPVAKRILEDLIEDNIKFVSQAHKKVMGTQKRKRSSLKGPTKAELREEIKQFQLEIRRLENINKRLITYIKEKGFWDEIKNEFGVIEMTPSAEPTPKQLREAELR